MTCWLALGASAQPRAAAAPAPKPAPAILLDDFETVWPWANESADDHASLSVTTENATSGQHALRIDFEAFGRGKFQARRDGRLDLSRGARLLVDVFSAAPQRMRMALGIECGRPPFYYESPRVPIQTGWNRNISFDLSAARFSRGDENYRHAPSYLDNTSKLSLLFFEDGNRKGAVFLDNLRLAPAASAPGQGPALGQPRAVQTVVPLYGVFEVEAPVSAQHKNPFDRAEASLWATFYSPSGAARSVPGFYDGPRPGDTPAWPAWKVRFSPDEPGRWIYRLNLRDAQGETTSELGSFDAVARPDSAGGVRISRADPTCFELANGDPFYPIGQNVAWASNIEHYFKAVAAYGGNTVRVWLCPWHLPIETVKDAGQYDLDTARQLDAVLGMARDNGLRVMLVLFYHGILKDTWAQCPYNAANGGPCQRPEDFFTNRRAIDLVKRKMEYLAARYGAFSQIFSWELFNEVDYTAFHRFEDVVEWHREVGEHLRASDPHRRLITTSIGSTYWRGSLKALPVIDFLAPHIYTTSLGEGVDRIASQAAPLRKPVFLGEFAGYPNAADERADRQGVFLHAGLWYAFMTPWAGAALPWWWDTHIEADNLYHHLHALAQFAKGEDRRGHVFRLVETTLSTGGDRRANVRGILARGLAYAWVFDAAAMKDPALDPPPLADDRFSFRLTGMKDGLYQVEVWDTWTGQRLAENRVQSLEGKVTVWLPATRRDLAIKARLITPGAADPGAENTPAGLSPGGGQR